MNLNKQCRKIKQSALFDPVYYLKTYADVRKADIDPLKHFCKKGWREGRNPSATFITRIYLVEHPELKDADINPLIHYIDSLKDDSQQISIFKKLQTISRSITKDPLLLKKFIDEVRAKGLRSALGKLKFDTKKRLGTYNTPTSSAYPEPIFPDRRLGIVPYYINPDPALHHTTVLNQKPLAIHIHVTDISRIDALLSRLDVGKNFDLFLTLLPGLDQDTIKIKCRAALQNLSTLTIDTLPKDTGSMMALLRISKKLIEYPTIGHFHTNTSLCIEKPEHYYEEALDLILDKPEQREQQKKILELLQNDAKIIYPGNTCKSIKDPTGWYGEQEDAEAFFAKYTEIDISDYEAIDSPESGFFWAHTHCLKSLFELADQEIKEEVDLDHLLMQTLLLFIAQCKGKAYRLHKSDSLQDYRFYETQKDYSNTIIYQDIKILAYYLPQFHPIPENDEWHGKGFTEWTKVRGATPLFEGHYKQHIPHPDIGYYLLDSPDTLKMQAEMMQKSGVYGQIFYHYWFSGKLILEEPVKMLRDNPNIAMPYCFCWANENWTRRWDGDDDDILLGQIYSKEDAKAFIRYLMPFFKDARYIRIENRPVLYVYRPASIPDIDAYLEVWSSECIKEGLPKPYVVGVLTRGATDPNAFHLDAGTERVLHDWTDNGVADIGYQLHHYHKLDTHILSYDEVATFYENQTEPKPFAYFRSIIATWDNTARYGKDAYLVHDSTPKRFQVWLENLIDFSRKTLDENKRFIVVNAWNEWAEGAHLEPDTHYGYSYLNAIGRALSAQAYTDELNTSKEIPKNTKVTLSFSNAVIEAIQTDSILRQQFEKVISQSTLLDQHIVTVEQMLPDSFLSSITKETSSKADYVLIFREAALFELDALEKMLGLALSIPESLVISNHYTQNEKSFQVTENGSVGAMALYDAPLILMPESLKNMDYKNIRMRTDTHSFSLNPSIQNKSERKHVTTIVRLHKGADFSELKKALLSLAAMQDCIVTPLLAIQDLNDIQKDQLKTLLDKIPFTGNNKPQIEDYSNSGYKGDLRTLMLNDALKKVNTRYAAILDYDDFLFPDAYAWLLERLEKTGKAVTFGRVYATSYDSHTDIITERKRIFEYGYSYEDFLQENHAPIHSFMLDLEQIDLSKILYHADQKYMEDYFLTLQIFTEDNCDWESLRLGHYIGDYIHRTDGEHTLAIADQSEKNELLQDPLYLKDEKRICDLRKDVSNKL